MDTTDQRSTVRHNRRHSDAFKLDLVRQAQQPGMSVTRVARDAGVNANQVFAWIKQHREGALRALNEAGSALLAVRVAEPEVVTVAASPRAPVRSMASESTVPAALMAVPSGTLALRLAHGELKIEDSPDRHTLETVLRWLTR